MQIIAVNIKEQLVDGRYYDLSMHVAAITSVILLYRCLGSNKGDKRVPETPSMLHYMKPVVLYLTNCLSLCPRLLVQIL